MKELRLTVVRRATLAFAPALLPVRRSQQQIIAYRVGSKTGVQPIDVSAHVDWNQ